MAVKLAATDQNSRDVGVNLGAYLREVTFYSELRDRIGGDGTLAECHLATHDPEEGWFTLVLEDIADGVQGDQIAGCGPEEARIAMVALARIHAPVFGDLALAATDWLNQPTPLNQALLTALLPGFLERYRDRIAPEHAEVCERFVASADAWDADRRPPLGLVHGDYRLDNLLFHDGTCTVVDWQTLGFGPAMRDAAYFLGSALPVEERRAHEESLLRAYHDELLAHGVAGFDWEQCWEEYRRQCFLLLVMTIAPAMVVERTDRGDDMFMAVFGRAAQMAIDLNATELLPEPDAGANAPLRPDPADEGTHDPGPEELWNESWYLDAVSDDGGLGVYHRIGRLPNTDACLITTCIVRPGEPAIMLVDSSAPLPPADDEAQAVTTEAIRASHHCVEPLERFRVEVEGTAAAHADHSAPLRKEAGEPVEIAVDLTWETDGVPYQWRLATRYEIPCRVSGTVRLGDGGVRALRPRPARSLVGRARLVGQRLDVERPAPRRRHPHPRRLGPDPPGLRGRLRAARRRADRAHQRELERAGRRQRPDHQRADRDVAGRHRGRARAAGLRSDPARGARRPHLPLPPSDVPRARDRRPPGPRLGRVEPQPAIGVS